MSQTEETNKPTETPEASKDPVADQADELEIVDAMKPAAAPTSNNKPLRYGNRKKKAGESGPTITNLSSVSNIEEEEIEMDDLPVRANAPEELIDTRKTPNDDSEDGESRPRRQNRSRGERRERKPRSRTPETTSEESESSEAETQQSDQEPNRPERFGTVKKTDGNSQVQEFRPSRDGRTAPKREPRREAIRTSKPAKPAKKKGILSKIISFFTGGDKEEENAPRSRNNRDGQKRSSNGRRRRGPQGRTEQNDEGNPNKRRRRRPRNRKPRDGDDSNNPRPRGQGPDGEGRQGNNRRRRSRRPRRQGQGQREKQESSSS